MKCKYIFILVVAGMCLGMPDQGFAESPQEQGVQPGHTSLWVATDRDGEGWVLEILDSDLALMYWFTYDEDGGQRWMISTGEIQGDQIMFPELLMPRGGRFGDGFDPDEIVNDVVGQAVMSFADCDQGYFDYEAFGQSQAIAIERLSRTDGLPCDGIASEATNFRAGFTGSWFDPSRAGEGYVLQVMANGAAVVVWFTFDPEGNAYWILANGHPEGNELVFSEMLATRGARFGEAFEAEDVERFPWGELRLALGCDAGTATYISLLPEFGSGQLNLVPLTRPESIVCEDADGIWLGQGPFGGDVFSLGVSPHKPERIYAAPSWGLFRSDNEGQTWMDLSARLDTRRLQAIKVAPHDADRLYVTTSTELLKSADGGHSWVHVEPDPARAIAGRLTMDFNPHNPSEVTVAAPNRGGLYRSSDGGTSWTRLDEGFFDGIMTFAYWPDDPDLLMVVGRPTGSTIARIYRSTNGGLDWDLAQLDVPNTPGSGINFVPHADGRLLLSVVGAGWGIGSTVFESADNGANWLRFASDCPLLDDPDFFPRIIEIDQEDANVWYMGGFRGLLQFTDSGQNCSVVSHGLTTSGLPDMNADVYSLKLKPGDSNVLYAGTGHAGFFRSDDGGDSWEQRNQGLSRTSIRSLAHHPANGSILYAGYGDAYAPADALWISADGGANWSADVEGLGLTGVRDIAIDPNAADSFEETHMYAVGWGWQYTGVGGGVQDGSAGVFKSVDGGRSWFESGDGIPLRNFENQSFWGDHNRPLMRSVVLAPNGDGGPTQTVYVAGNGLMTPDSSVDGCTPEAHRIYKSVDAGNSWLPADDGLPYSCNRTVQVVPIVIDPVDPKTLYVGTFLTVPIRLGAPMPTPLYENGVFKSTDGGTSWTLSSQGLPRFDESDPASSPWDVLALAVAPSSPNVLYAAVKRSFHVVENFVVLPRLSMVYRSTDSGASWSPANGGMPEDVDIRSLVVDPDDAETVYASNARVSTDTTVYRSIDGGANWAPYSDGLSGPGTVLMMEQRDSGTILHAGTHAGVFSIREKD